MSHSTSYCCLEECCIVCLLTYKDELFQGSAVALQIKFQTSILTWLLHLWYSPSNFPTRFSAAAIVSWAFSSSTFNIALSLVVRSNFFRRLATFSSTLLNPSLNFFIFPSTTDKFLEENFVWDVTARGIIWGGLGSRRPSRKKKKKKKKKKKEKREKKKRKKERKKGTMNNVLFFPIFQ